MARSNRSAQPRLGVELLQARVVPAVVVTQLDLDSDGQADDIQIVGDAAKNFVSIKDNGTTTLTISVDANGDGDLTDVGDMDNVNYTVSGRVAIVAKLGGAKDSFNYELTGPLVSRARDITVALGQGNDKASIVTGDITDSIFGGAQFDVDIAGGKGHDKVLVTTGKVTGSMVGLNLNLGQGSDTAATTFGDIDYKSSVDVEADLGDGNNALEVDLQGVGYSDRANMHIDILGGIDVDTVWLKLHDDVGSSVEGSSLQFNANLGAGNDNFTASMYRDSTAGSVDFDVYGLVGIAVNGGAGDDILVAKAVGGTGNIYVSGDNLLDISLKGGAGNDTVSVNLGGPNTLYMATDGGLRVRMDGGAGNDTMSLLLANNNSTTGFYDVALHAGAGDDAVTFDLENNGGSPTYSPKMPVLDGGLGNDTLTDGNKPESSESFFETII